MQLRFASLDQPFTLDQFAALEAFQQFQRLSQSLGLLGGLGAPDLSDLLLVGDYGVREREVEGHS